MHLTSDSDFQHTLLNLQQSAVAIYSGVMPTDVPVTTRALALQMKKVIRSVVMLTK